MPNPADWTVLVVEDLDDSIQVISQILGHHGVDVHVAHDGVECLRLLEDITPTLLVVDLHMPELDGWGTLAAIRQNPATAALPVVAVTAYHSVHVAEDAHNAGFDAYFPKPIAAGTFVTTLAELINEPANTA